MKCFVCNKGTFVRKLADVAGKVKRKTYTVKTPALVCGRCGHVAMEGVDMQEYIRGIADEYRRENGLYTSGQIRAIRGALSQQRFAEALGVGVASVKRWELGMVQDKSNNRLIEEFQRRERPRWSYEGQYAAADRSQFLQEETGLWALAHGPPPWMSSNAAMPAFVS